jgi:uncharacterized protein YjiS (DUF1127 family)
MSTFTMFADVQQYSVASVKPHRTVRRWLRLAVRVRVIVLRRRFRRRAAIRALEVMDEHMLRDIGMDRGRIEAAVQAR